MVNIFQNPKWKQEYAIEINNKFEILENFKNDNNIKKKWEIIKTTIKEIKQQLIEKMKAQKHLKINGSMRNANLR